METAKHNEFSEGVKSFKAYEANIKKMAAEFEHLRFFIVQAENDAASLEIQVKNKKEELAELDRQAKERRLMADSNHRATEDRLNKRHLEIVEREAKVRFAEQAAQEQLNKANKLLAAAEAKSPTRKAVAAGN